MIVVFARLTNNLFFLSGDFHMSVAIYMHCYVIFFHILRSLSIVCCKYGNVLLNGSHVTAAACCIIKHVIVELTPPYAC